MAHRRIAAIAVLITTLILTLPAEAQQKPVALAGTSPGIAGGTAHPFTQEQASNMVGDGLGDESGAKLIG